MVRVAKLFDYIQNIFLLYYMTEQYKIDYIENKCPDEYIQIMTLANCVQSKKLSEVFSSEITEKNHDSLCSIDIHNLPYLHYLTFYILDNKTDIIAYNKLINGFCTHQGIGFTKFIDNITGQQMTLDQQLQQMKQIKSYLRKQYKKTVSLNSIYTTLFIITMIDIVHHGLRVLSSLLYLIFEPKKSLFTIAHNIMHWISLFTNIYFVYFTYKSEKQFEKYVSNPILLSSWLCAHGKCETIIPSCHQICDTTIKEY